MSRLRSADEAARAGGWALGAAGRGLFFLAILAAVVPKGATQGPALSAYCALAGLTFLAAALTPPLGRSGSVFRLFLLLAVLLGGYVLMQSAQFADNPVANPVWENVRPILGIETGAISVMPRATRDAVFPLLAPVLVYLSALALFPTDALAFRLWKFLGLLAGVFALFGILQLQFFPTSMLLAEKEFYRDSLTGFFVNRNSAGTLLGAASFVIAGWLLLEARQTGWRLVARGGSSFYEAPARRQVRLTALSVLYATVLIALFMTKSRGALLCTVIAYLAAGPLLWLGSATPEGRGEGQDRIRRLGLRALGVAAPVVLVALIFGGQSFLRMEQRGIDVARLCAYASTWRAFADNWLFGTGFATFASVFPAYRDAACAGAYGVWNRAHNVWLEALMGLGVAFVPLAAIVCVTFARILVVGYRTRRRLRPFVLAGTGIVVLVTVHGMLDFSLQIPGMAAYAAAAMAAVTTVCLRRAGTRPVSLDR